jgi:carboxymethylenebutenolidase
MPEHELAALREEHCCDEFETRDVDATMATMVAIAQFRDGQVAHQHIDRDQASVRVRIGILDPRGLPVAGAETARKVLDPNRPSSTLLGDARRSGEGKPV